MGGGLSKQHLGSRTIQSCWRYGGRYVDVDGKEEEEEEGGGVDGREMAGGGGRDRSQQGKLQPTVTAGMARSKGEIALRWAETI